MNIGDMVTRKSYNNDIIFKIVSFIIDSNNQKIAILKGVAFRVLADSNIEDLEIVNQKELREILIDTSIEKIINKTIKIINITQIIYTLFFIFIFLL